MKKALKLLAVILVFFAFLLLKSFADSFGIYRDTLNTTVYLSVIDPSVSYTVIFNTQGGTAVNPSSPWHVTPNTAIGTLPTTTQAGYNFVGWYTDPTNGTKVEPYTLITANNTNFYAHWEPIVCKKATTLHNETCSTDGSCLNATHIVNDTVVNYQLNDTITYGNIPGANSPLAGDAYDCDVDNDGVWDPDTERFYYIREEDDNGDLKAVLVHFTSFDQDGQMDDSDQRQIYTYTAGLDWLPDSSTWTNPKLTTIDSKVSRYLTRQDIAAACGDIPTTAGAWINCQYLLENSKFKSGSTGRSGIWAGSENGTNYRIQTAQLTVLSVNASSQNAVRPVIEIPFNTIEGYVVKDSYQITLETLDGETPTVLNKYANEELGILPIPTRTGYMFKGWYTTPALTTLYDPTTIVTANTTYFAKWDEDTDNLEYVFYIPGECNFNGSGAYITSNNNDCISTINPTGQNIDYTTGSKKYINTGVSLYSHDNIGKDYEIGFTVETYNPSLNPSRAVFMNTKKEETGYPGAVVRRDESTTSILLQSRKTQSANEQITIDSSTFTSVVIIRRDGKMYYKLNGGQETYLHDIDYNPEFDIAVWFGAGPSNAAGTGVNRYLVGTLSNMYIKLEADSVSQSTVTFDASPGVADYSSKTVNTNQAIGSLPGATQSGFEFDGWWTAATGGTRVTESTIVTGDITYHAHWKNKYLITFNGNGGTVSINPNTILVTDGESIGALNLPTATMANKAFDGWWTAATGGTRIDGTETITADDEYFAHYKNLYTVTFNGEGGTVSINPNTLPVGDGESIGAANLPTATKANAAFDGWWTAASGGTRIDGTETITASVEYHAHYKNIYTVTFNGEGGTVSINPNTMPVIDGESIGAANLPTASKSDGVFNGWWTAASGGTRIDGTETITASVEYHAQYVTSCQVRFNGNGGDPSETIKTVGYGHAVGALPTVQRINYIFDGWYTDNTLQTPVDPDTTIIYGGEEFFAKWTFADYTAVIGYTGYTSLQDAIDAVEENGAKTTITLLKNVTAESGVSFDVDDGRDIYLDLGGYNIAANGNKVFWVNNGTLELSNGTITSTANQGALNTESNGTLIINDITVTITGSSSKQAVYNNGGTTYIRDGAVFSNVSSNRATVHNLGNGTMVITGGTITANGCYAVYNALGSLTIGTKDGTVDTTSPIIQGKTYGVVSYSTYNFYDGTIKGKTDAIALCTSSATPPAGIAADTNEDKIADIEDDTETTYVTGSTYKELSLSYTSNGYRIILDPRGGEIANNHYLIVVTPTDPVGAIPEPTRGLYTFAGWYDIDGDVAVNANTVPTQNTTYYATWTYTPSHETSDIMNSAMRTYYNNISTWKSNQSTFQTNMDANFNNYSCQECNNNPSNPYQSCPIEKDSNTIQCDRPRGFNTGVDGDVNVYVGNPSNYVKGSPVDYVSVKDGIIYNMIPGETYYWESDDDPNVVYGTVTATGERRIMDVDNVRNVRDLGGLEVDYDGDNTPDGTLKYNRIFRGVRLASGADITSLQNIGVTEEVDLREANGDTKLGNYQRYQIVNYEIDYANYPNNYTALKTALTNVMNDVINGENIYFHCKIGTDRTGTLAWFLEGLLGVSEEDRIQDYELSYFYGLLNRHRFYSNQPGSSITHRFTYMHGLYPNNSNIYDYYTKDPTTGVVDQTAVQRVNAFRAEMINLYS